MPTQYKFTVDTRRVIGRPSVRGRPIVTREQFERIGCGVFVTQTRHGKIKNLGSDRLYLILEGEGTFTIDDRDIPVAAGDVVIVPRGTPYDYAGKLKVFLVHAPANLDEADIDLEPPPPDGLPPDPPDRVL
jgi:ethanolamine utilization protein EutQ (cupin superfamily)